MINRVKLRGKPLDADCKAAKTTTHECGPNDDRVFCYGLYDKRYDAPYEKCYDCKAFVENATPLEDTKLRPCPFCGGKARAVVDDATEELFLIQCADCKATTWEFEELEDAEKAWNRRATDERTIL